MAWNKKMGTLVLSATLCGITIGSLLPVHADSTVIDGPGFKVQNNQGWFGQKSTSYQDAMGNTIEKKKGLFGRTKTRTKIFGSEAVKNGNNVSVTDANGQPLITTRRTLFRGKQTRVNGNNILNSVQDLFK